VICQVANYLKIQFPSFANISCTAVDKVEEIEASALTPKDFLMNYVMLSKPLVIKNAIKDWPAMQWTNYKLKDRLGKG
jgi:hypothetical protein